MPFETTEKIRFGHVDKAGIAYYPAILHLCHIAFEKLLEDYFDIPLNDLIENENFAMPTVNIQADFKTPFKFGEEIIFSISIPHIGNKSVQFCYDLLDSKDRTTKAKILITTVATKIATLEPILIPSKYRTLFQQLNK